MLGNVVVCTFQVHQIPGTGAGMAATLVATTATKSADVNFILNRMFLCADYVRYFTM